MKEFSVGSFGDMLYMKIWGDFNTKKGLWVKDDKN